MALCGKMVFNSSCFALAVSVIALLVVCSLIAIGLLYRWTKKVKQNSEYYKSVLQLNCDTQYYSHIGNNGNVEYIMRVKTKAQYDRTHSSSALDQYLQQHYSEISSFLDMVHQNRSVYIDYITRFNLLFSKITREECKKLRIPYARFLKIEQKLVDAEKIYMIQAFSVTCYVKYTSPQGRNRYLKHCTYQESEIRTALQAIKERKAYQLSEEYRRKNERAKVTPSMRYNILQRDGGKCQLCGRTADDGVVLEVDHIIPISKGGSTTHNNLQTLCRECNRGKSTKAEIH